MRKVIVITAFLVCGAIVNVAVAWGFALYIGSIPSKKPYRQAVEPEVATDLWKTLAPPQWQPALHSKASNFRMSAPGVTELVLTATDGSSIPPRGGLASRRWAIAHGCAGWPTRALQYQCRAVWERDAVSYQEAVTNESSYCLVTAGSRSPTWLGGGHVFPLRPVWPGFAINTILYAGILWLLFAAPFKVRRWRRIKRGLCPTCAYPVGASEVCTECGMLVSAGMPRMLEAGNAPQSGVITGTPPRR